jgi:hypothetical protein
VASNPRGAEASYSDALALAQRQGAKLFALRSATSLARLWRDQDKRTEACDLLAPIYDRFTEGFDTPDPKRSCLVAYAAEKPGGRAGIEPTYADLQSDSHRHNCGRNQGVAGSWSPGEEKIEAIRATG